jgi:predicted aspartyl protease
MATGYLDANGDPFVKVTVTNLVWPGTELECLIDTGFTGFLSIPIVQAFPLGLFLTGSLALTLADGKQAFRYTCLGCAELDGRKEMGLIVIEPGGSQTLLGMAFLKKFNLQLVVDPVAGLIELKPGSVQVAAPPPQPPDPSQTTSN